MVETFHGDVIEPAPELCM